MILIIYLNILSINFNNIFLLLRTEKYEMYGFLLIFYQIEVLYYWFQFSKLTPNVCQTWPIYIMI